MPTTLIDLPQTNLAHNAGFNSVPDPGAIALPADCESLTCSLTMSAADQLDAANAIAWTVYVAPPGAAPTVPPPADSTPGNGWTPIALEYWQGGTYVDHQGNTQPLPLVFTEGIQAAYQGGWVAAVGRNTGATLRVGCTVASNP